MLTSCHDSNHARLQFRRQWMNTPVPKAPDEINNLLTFGGVTAANQDVVPPSAIHFLRPLACKSWSWPPKPQAAAGKPWLSRHSVRAPWPNPTLVFAHVHENHDQDTYKINERVKLGVGRYNRIKPESRKIIMHVITNLLRKYFRKYEDSRILRLNYLGLPKSC